LRGLTYGTYPELLYSMPASGAPLANSASRALLSTAAAATSSEPFRIPPSFWDPARNGGQAFLVELGGFISTTGTPTFQLQAALNTTQGTFGTALAATGAFTTASGLASAAFTARFRCVTQAIGASGTLSVTGELNIGAAANAATTAATTYMLGTSALAAVNTTVDNYLEVWGTWGTASVSNTVTLQQLLVWALN
jgi:hypothetical protein